MFKLNTIIDIQKTANDGSMKGRFIKQEIKNSDIFDFVDYGSERSKAIVLPAHLRNDSAFPFKEDQELEIEIVDKKIIITSKKA